MKKYCFFIAYLLIVFNINAQSNSFDVMLDSIQRLRKLSKDKNLEINTRLLNAKRASELSYKTGVDSTILLSNRKLTSVYLIEHNHEMVRDISYKNLKLARKLNDSLSYALACANLAYGYLLSETQNDSAYFYYYKTIKISKKLNHSKLTISSLNNIAHMQNDERDYIGCDVTLFKVINLIQSLPKNDGNFNDLVQCYNSIGTNSRHLGLYDEAIEYYKQALLINDKLSDKIDIYINKLKNYLYTKINLAEAYKFKGSYKKALSIHEELLKDKGLLKKDPLSYVAIINNKAHTLFLAKNSNTKYINSLFNEAYKISDSLNALYEISAGGNDMAEFYHAINKKDSAYILSKRSYKIGKNIKNYYEVSRALSMLSKIEKGEVGKQYLYEHIKLNDSLLDVERTSRNKFARVQFETDTLIHETKRLATQNILIVVTGLIVFLILAFVFIIRNQIAKNKILRFESEQQKANEEIYTLMLRQQAKVEEGRLLERHRISEELHDGILNKLLGSRLGLEFLSMDEDTESKEKYGFYIHEIQSIEREIRDLSHELKNTQLDADKDFMTILKDYIGNQSSLHPFQYKINQNGTIFWEAINDYIKVNLYRIIQEAIQNVIKHAKATTLTVDFSLNSNELHLDIRDNGIGFNPNQKHEGIGLLNIASRVSKLKGTFNMKSEIKKGTTLAIKIPLFKPL